MGIIVGKKSRFLLSSAAVGACLTLAFPAVAAQDALSETTASEASLDTIIVTGSRIRRTGADSPTPTTVVSSETIRMSGVTEIADLMNEIPSLFISQNNQTSNQSGNAGLNALDLRGLGTERTLVLVNGRRRVPAMPGSSAVDVSAIPTGMVERVDVVTGGASALYGADAVAGVVNYILKKDYEGYEVNAQTGGSTRGDLNSYDLNVLYGHNFSNGRGNITLFGNYSHHAESVAGQDRPWTARGTPYYNPVGDGRYELMDGVRNIYDHNGAIVELGGKGNLFAFNPDGSLRKPQLGPSGIFNLDRPNSELASYLTDGGEFGGRYDDWLLQVPSKRLSLNGALNYDVSDSVSAFVDFSYSRTRSRSESRARTSYGYNYVPTDSPFITDEMIEANGGPITGPLAFTRRFNELGRGQTLYRRSMFQVTAGFDGTLPEIFGREWSWSAHYSYGQTRQKVAGRNLTADERYANALDSTTDANGNAVCRSSLTDPGNGCVALNPFKPLTQDMIDYLQYDTSWARQTMRQHVVSAYATGDLFDLPAGAVQAVIGAEYRRESNNIGAIPEYEETNPLFDPTLGSIETGLSGHYDVKEVFGELRVPLASSKPFFEELSIEGAVRFSDYSTAGTTTAYKMAANWAPVEDIRFRTTYGQAVRAPNISELYTASRVSSSWLRDPCNYYDIENRTTRSEFTAANCAILNPQNTNEYYQWLPVNYTGNPDLDVETAKTLTVGVVLQPRFIRNFSFTVDYFDIDLSDAISTFDAQTIMERCVDAPTLDNMFCNYVTRNPANNNLVTVEARELNVSKFKTRGVDFELNYRFNLEDIGLGANSGALSVNAAYTRLIKRDFILDPSNPNTIEKTAGVFGSPKWKGAIRTTYTNGPVAVNWTARHIGSMRPTTSITADKYDVTHTGDVFYHDFYVSYDATERFTLYGGLRNAFDRQPPRLPGAESGGANFEYGYQAGVYDAIGRMFYIGATFRN